MIPLDRIVTDPTRMNGQPCLRDLRLTVRRVLEVAALYPDRAERLAEYPEIDDEDVRQALHYAALHLPSRPKAKKPLVHPPDQPPLYYDTVRPPACSALASCVLKS